MIKNIYIKKILLGLIGIFALTNLPAQEIVPPTLTVYNFNDQSCINNVSDNGKWAVSFGPSQSNSSEYSNARLINIETNEVIALGLENDETVPLFCTANDVTDDGMVVGRYKGQPAIWTQAGGWKILDLPIGWSEGQLASVTPDGRYAVGKAFRGYAESQLLYDLTTLDIMDTPGVPIKGSAGEDLQQVRFTNITADGRYIEGIADFSYTWNTLSFIYDRENGKCIHPGFKEDGTPAYVGVTGINGTFSPNGKWYAGSAYIVSGSSEYECPFRYNMETEEFELYNNTVNQNYGCVSVDNEGIIYASTPLNTPVRTLYIFVNGFWYPLDDLLTLRYGMDFYGLSGYDNTGTVMGISGNGKAMAAFPDPYRSYILKMNESFADAALNVNLLKSYTATPADGASLTSLKNIEVEFKYDVQLLGTRNDLTLTDRNGNAVGKIVGVNLSSASNKKIIIAFRSTSLTANEEYTLTIPAGFVALSSDATRQNAEIKLNYTGRAASPVKVVSVSPESGSSLTQLDVNTNPVLLTYDTDVKLAENAVAYLYRDEDTAPIAELNLATSTVASQSKMILVFPTASQYLFLNSNYKIVIPAGAVTDSNGDNPSEEYTLNYEGLYKRVIVSDNENLYFEDFSNGVNNVIMRDGDGNTPDQEMQELDFLQAGDNYAWVPLRDDNESDYAAASTSAYNPAGKSDDWMMTTQVYIPDEKCRLEFDAQSYRNNKTDKLKVIVYADETVYNYLDADLCEKIRTEGKVVMDEVLSPGANESVLKGDWTSYSFDLPEYAGKSIYVAFINENEAQSIVFVDNIKIIHDNGFLTALTSATTTINQESIEVTGSIVVTSSKDTFSDISIKLLDAEKKVVDEINASGLSLVKDDNYDFAFNKELPLETGKENVFYISVELGKYSDEIAYTVKNLAFQPVKRVIIEENTGMNCGFCPLGHVAWEYISSLYGDRVMLAAYHTYNGGDQYASGMTSYSQNFLGLSAAPTAIINRGSETASPMYNEITEGKRYYKFTAPDGSCWLDMINKEFETDADADLSVSATYDAVASQISVPFTAKFAMNMDKQNIGLFLIVTEDGLIGYQDNNFSSCNTNEYVGIEDWCSGGKYGNSTVYPYTQSEVARAHVGSSYYGTTGYIPATITAGEEYTGTITFDLPSTITEIKNCRVLCMMIDANTGKVINNAQTIITDPSGINGTIADSEVSEEVARYNAAGQRIAGPQKGLNIIKYANGTTRKVLVK